MNKFTHTFRQQHLEILYQKDKELFCYNAFKKICAVTFIITIMRLITFSQNQMTIGILITSAILLMLVLMGILIVKFCPSGAIYCLLLINHLLMLLQLYDHAETNEFILGTNLAIIHTTIMLVLDFKLAIINSFIQSAIKLLIAGFFDNQTDACSVIMSILCPLCFLTIANIFDKQRRQIFLSQSQGNDWHCLLPNVISDPFIMFTYDEQWTSFKFRNSCNIDKFPHASPENHPELNFRQFIRMTQVGNITLEQHILNRIENHSNVFALNQLSLRTNTLDELQEVKILFAELYHIEDNFLIILEQNKQKAQNLESTKECLISLINQHQQLVYNFLQKQGQLITKAIFEEKNRLQCLYQIKLHHLYFQGKYKVSNSFAAARNIQEVMPINFKQLFFTIIQIFQQAYPDWNFNVEAADGNYDAKIDKEQTADFLVQLFQILIRKTKQDFLQMTRIVLHSTEQLIYIRIICTTQYILVENLNKNILIKQYLTTHSPESEIKIQQTGICLVQLYRDIEELKSFDKFGSSNF